MGSHSRLPAAAGVALIVAAAFASCATVNRLDRYRPDAATVAANLRVPPEPKFDVHYSVTFDTRNPVGTALSIGTNIAVAAEAKRAESRMEEALLSVDIPSIVLEESYTACAKALDARKVGDRNRSAYLLDVEIREYGLRASSPHGAVSLVMKLTARLYDNRDERLIWRRKIATDDPATPVMFGFGGIIGNVVTAGVLANLSTEEIAKGFERLARESSRSLARRLERDLYAARYR